MADLVETRVTQMWRTRCPHCRPPTQSIPTREAVVTVHLDNSGKITDLKIDCDWAHQGQDRT